MINTHLNIRNILLKWNLLVSYLVLPEIDYNQ